MIPSPARSVSLEASVAQQFQPMGMGLPIEQFGRALANAFGAVTAEAAVMVEIEPQQFQIVVANLSAKEEVVAKTTIAVLHQRTGPGRTGDSLADGRLDWIKPVPQFLA